MTDLAALAPKTVEVVVTIDAYGGDTPRREIVELKTLSHHRWNEIGARIPNPPVPKTRIDSVTKEKVENPLDPEYQAELLLRSYIRNRMRLADAIEGGGTPVPGESLEDKAVWLGDNIDAGVMNALIVFLSRAAERGLAQITTRAASFQPVRNPGAGDTRQERVDGGDLVGANGHRERHLASVDDAPPPAD